MKPKTKKTILLILFALFFICNWMMDVNNIAETISSAGNEYNLVNGLWTITDFELFYHLYWYASIIIFVIFAICLIREIK